MMRVEIYLQDENGKPALFVAEADCLALDPADVHLVKNFRPRKFNRIIVFQDDGWVYNWTPSLEENGGEI